MAVNLIDLLGQEYGGDVVARVATSIGESPAATQQAIGGAVPAVLGALAGMASTPSGAGGLLRMLQSSGLDGGRLGSMSVAVGSPGAASNLLTIGGPLVSSLFGSRQSGLVDWLAKFSGMGRQSSTSLLALVVPHILTLVAKQASASGGLNAVSLAGLLTGQKSFLQKAAPAGLEAALGVPGYDRPLADHAMTESGKGGLGWLKWLVPLLALLAVLWGLRSGRPTTPSSPVANSGPETSLPAVQPGSRLSTASTLVTG